VNLFYQPELLKGNHFLDEEESRHAIKVLRLRERDSIEITDGAGTLYSCTITRADPKKCEFEVITKVKQSSKRYTIHIAIAPTKNMDRIEWFVEKAIEIGIDQISFLLCQKSERKTVNIDRIQKLAVSAMKQSQQNWMPQIQSVIPFTGILDTRADQKFIAYVDDLNPDHLKSLAMPSKSYLMLIGPEGDFSKEELAKALEKGFKKVSLGPNRLRTETAGLVACQILNLINL
jgi:16S rRNA (uracil1498-N3)-methyltransferase